MLTDTVTATAEHLADLQTHLDMAAYSASRAVEEAELARDEEAVRKARRTWVKILAAIEEISGA